MKKYFSIFIVLCVLLLTYNSVIAGMLYAPSSFCTLRAQIVSINGQNLSFKVVDIIGLSQEFYQSFPHEKSFSDKDCKKYYSPNSAISASSSQNLTNMKSGDKVRFDIYLVGDEWGNSYMIDNIELDNSVVSNFGKIKSNTFYLVIIFVLLLIILYLIFNKPRKKVI